MVRWPTTEAGMLGAGLGVCLAITLAVAAQPPAQDYSPVSPPAAMHAAVQSSLKLVQDWLDQKDFLSAAQAAQELIAVAQLYSYQGAQPEWQSRASALREACARLNTATRAKDAAACGQAVEACQRLLGELGRESPAGAKVIETGFRPFGSNRTWMMLMDGAYTDAKSAPTPREVESLAYQIAEEANVVGYLRPDARWRTFAAELRDTALGIAKKAPASDLETTRRELKAIYRRCEACHEGYKR